MARRKKRPEHENHDRWLISYADFVTLLFAFFVVMYSISSVNEGKYKTFSNSLSNAFSAHPVSRSDTAPALSQQEQLFKALVDRRTARLGEQQRKIQERMKMLANNLNQLMLPLIKQGLVNVTQSKRGVVIDISASVLFRPGEANLQPDSIVVIQQVAEVLRNESEAVEVEGHTDDLPISTVQFPSNWELSSARASGVVRVLIDNGVQVQRLTAVGMASNQPVAANDSAVNRAKNRRVSITLLSPFVEQMNAGGNNISGAGGGG